MDTQQNAYLVEKKVHHEFEASMHDNNDSLICGLTEKTKAIVSNRLPSESSVFYQGCISLGSQVNCTQDNSQSQKGPNLLCSEFQGDPINLIDSAVSSIPLAGLFEKEQTKVTVTEDGQRVMEEFLTRLSLPGRRNDQKVVDVVKQNSSTQTLLTFPCALNGDDNICNQEFHSHTPAVFERLDEFNDVEAAWCAVKSFEEKQAILRAREVHERWVQERKSLQQCISEQLKDYTTLLEKAESIRLQVN